MKNESFYEIPYPSSRQFTFDLGKIGREKHHVKALLEVDITEARRKIKEIRRTGEKASVIAWIIKVIADCAALHPPICGINNPKRNRVAVFDHVDISMIIEKEVDGAKVPLPYVIREAESKTLGEIYAEIESAKSQTCESESDYVIGRKYNETFMKLFVKFPQWMRLLFMRCSLFSDPMRMNKAMGTVMITTAGMAGHTQGWIMPFSMHPLCIALGSVNEQPAIYKGEILKREILHLTILIDHDAIDGIPAARFVNDLIKKMENSLGLSPASINED